ncbi:MFS transporter [Meridianimarinicoccus sp. RP-17]
MTDTTGIAPARAGAATATRLSFFAAGFVMAAWAPLIPFAKQRVGADAADLGLVLLCLGLGSIIAMPVTGFVSAARGARGMVLLGGVGMLVLLPVLIASGTLVALGAALFVFGAAMGTIDVAMNVHAAEVERRAARPMMSGFHAMWSVGGIAGAGGATALLAAGAAPLQAALAAAAVAALCLAIAAPGLLRASGGAPPRLALPRGIVLLLSALTAAAFLVEGAILDWGALLMVERGLQDPVRAGLGFMFLSGAMAAGRLSGDRLVAAIGPLATLCGGGFVVAAGLVVMLWAPTAAIAMGGFTLVGLGAANLVPVLFSAAGRQTGMDPGLAIAAVTTTGYAGVLLGPAAIGAVAHGTSLVAAFWGLVVMMAAFPFFAAVATRRP